MDSQMGTPKMAPVAVDPVALVTTECITVTSAMRKHARWAHSSVSAILGGSGTGLRISSRSTSDLTRNSEESDESRLDGDDGLVSQWGRRSKKGKSMQDHPLMSAFARLRSDLRDCSDIGSFDTAALLHPFLQVIRSSSTSASITSLAIVAITKFFDYRIITANSSRLAIAMQLLSAAITHCRFEASDSSADEIVLLQILRLMESMMSGPGSAVLGDDSICEMMETGLSMCCQKRLSDLVRRSAEMSMIKMCQVIFERLNALTLDVEQPHTSHPLELTATSPEKIIPYSLPSIVELFRVLVDLLQPQHKEHTDALRVMALRIIDVALEVAGPSLARHPSLASLAKDDLCRYLFQLIRTDSTQLLNESLRVSGTLLATCREVLKLQQELFLSYLVECLHPRVEIPHEPGISPFLYDGIPKTPKAVQPVPSGGRSTPVPVKERHQLGMDGTSRRPDAREAMIESIGALCRIPTFLIELFINYDCELDRNDLCEDLVGLLCRNAFPDSATWSTTSVPPLSLDSLLTCVQLIADRLAMKQEPDCELVERLRAQRARKGVIIKGIMQFNDDPREGLAFLAANQVIDSPTSADSVARFLKSTTRVSKRRLGEFISKRDQEPLLKAFMDLFDFSNQRVDEALRDLLYTFRLPGESQLIERIVTVFSQKYCANTPTDHIANEDAVFTLTYSIIMLNTDQHNPNIKKEKRMTSQDFARNLRGVNGGKDFAADYLAEIYENIKTNEIILPDEHDNDRAFHYTWEGLLIKAQNAGSITMCTTNAFDADMFRTTWRPIVATLSYVFMSATDDAVFARVVLGFDQCAQIAAQYGLTDALDRIIACLSSITGLDVERPGNTALNTEVQVQKKRVMVSETAVKFGRNQKAQLACAVLFRLIPGKEGVIRKSWHQIISIWLNLLCNALIRPSLTQSEETLGLEPVAVQAPSSTVDRDQRGNEAGLLSTFTSYLSNYAADEPPEPSEEELESSAQAVECLARCPMDVIFGNLRKIDDITRHHLVTTLLARLPEPTSPVVLMARSEQVRPVPIKTNGMTSSSSYDASMVLILELATILTIHDSTSIRSTGEPLADALQTVIRNSANTHPLVLSRCIAFLLHLLNLSHDQSFIKTPLILHLLAGYNSKIFETVSPAILRGLQQSMKIEELRQDLIKVLDFWHILSRLCSISITASGAFIIIEDLLGTETPLISADNFEAAVKVLSQVASVGLEDQLKNRTSKDEVVRGQRAVMLLCQLSNAVPSLIRNSKLAETEAWMAYWAPVLSNLGNQCLNPVQSIRRQACSGLQTVLLSPKMHPQTDAQWAFVFDEILFDLVDKLLKPEVFQSDPTGMLETRLQAANLLCRTLLHHLAEFSLRTAFLPAYTRVLDIMDRLMNSSQGDSLQEAIPEIVKNILLIMADSKILVCGDGEIWTETAKRVDRSLPGLLSELFPHANPPEGSNSAHNHHTSPDDAL